MFTDIANKGQKRRIGNFCNSLGKHKLAIYEPYVVSICTMLRNFSIKTKKVAPL